MHVTAANVIAINGNTAKDDDASQHAWTSPEDWEHFIRLRDTFDLIVVDGSMYDSVQPTPEPGRLRVVITNHPEDYASKAVAGQLEFTSDSPSQVVKQLEVRGFTRMLLAGGPGNTAFWKAGLVNELFLTIEPYVLAEGGQFLDGIATDICLRLLDCKQVNERGTLILHYAVDTASISP